MLELISAEQDFFLGKVESVIVPGVEGDFGVRFRHAPMLAKLRPSGVLQFKVVDEVEARVFYVFGGFVEVQPTKTTVLADTVIRGPEIDQARMKAALVLETMLIKEGRERPVDYAKALAELAHFNVQWTRASAYKKLYPQHRKSNQSY